MPTSDSIYVYRISHIQLQTFLFIPSTCYARSHLHIRLTMLHHLRCYYEHLGISSHWAVKWFVLAFVQSWFDSCNAMAAGLPSSSLAPTSATLHAAVHLLNGVGPRHLEVHWLPIGYRLQNTVLKNNMYNYECRGVGPMPALYPRSRHTVNVHLWKGFGQQSLASIRRCSARLNRFWRTSVLCGRCTAMERITSCHLGYNYVRILQDSNDLSSF